MKNLMFRLATSLTSGSNAAETALNTAYNTFVDVMMTVLPIVLGVVLMIGMFFGIKLGITFAKAEDADARDKAKGQLINLCIGVGVAAVIMIIAMILVQNGVFKNAFSGLSTAKNS